MDEIEPAFLVEAERLLEEGKIREAAELCTRGLVKYPEYISAYLVLIHALEKMEDIIQMSEVIENAPNVVKFNPTIIELVKKYNINTSKVLEETDTELPLDDLPSEKEDLVKSGDDGLEKEINKAIRNDELNPDLLKKLTTEQNIFEEQELEIKETLTLAKIYEEQDAYAEALVIYKQLQELLEDKSIYADKILELETLIAED